MRYLPFRFIFIVTFFLKTRHQKIGSGQKNGSNNGELKKVSKTNERKPGSHFYFCSNSFSLTKWRWFLCSWVMTINFRSIFPMIYDLTRRYCVVFTATIVKDSLVLEGAKSRRCVRSHIVFRSYFWPAALWEKPHFDLWLAILQSFFR